MMQQKEDTTANMGCRMKLLKCFFPFVYNLNSHVHPSSSSLGGSKSLPIAYDVQFPSFKFHVFLVTLARPLS